VIDDAERWDARYEGRAPRAPRPPDGLAGIELPDAGLCLDVACGLGEQSLWAASLGFDVIAIDVSPVAIAALDHAATRLGVTDRIEARVVDLDGGLPGDVAGRCALVVCQRFRDPSIYPDLVTALAPGGVLVLTVLSQVGAVEPGSFHAPPGELFDHFSPIGGVEIVRGTESDGEATLVARRQAG
jgi:2-polyprenyl-3-methyl-5-hydroxy-6-metoxy-1,4-benzoquinol methylase